MPTLYVTEPGARIEKEYGRVVVSKDDEVLAAVPLAQISDVVLMRGVGVTTPALLALLDEGISLSLISAGGRLRGRLIAAEARNLPLRHKQYARSGDASFCCAISRAIVVGKLKNCRTLARRLARARRGGRSGAAGEGAFEPDSSSESAVSPRVEAQAPPASPPVRSTDSTSLQDPVTEAFGRLNTALSKASVARDLAELRGFEGSGSKAYFQLLKAALRAELTFESRTRRPPRDPANALLSLAYSLLTQAMFTACEVAGLDPYDGFYHADKYGRPALALDLIEEFRPVIADSVVLTVVNNHMLEPDDFEEGEDGGTYLRRRGLRKFLRQFGRRLNTSVEHPEAGRALTYQKVLEIQARRLRRCIEAGEPEYKPFLAR